jgi:hypothetical protein
MCEVLGFSNMPATSFPMKKKHFNHLIARSATQVRKLAGPKHSRSAVIEQSLHLFWDGGPERVLSFAVWNSLANAADRLNTEAAEVLDYA